MASHVIAPLIALVAMQVAAGAEPAPREPMIVKDVGEARFVPVSPAQPNGAAIAVLSGDPATGPSEMLLRMPRGAGRLHIHSADYRLVIVQGRMKHWAGGQDETMVPPLGPGSYWYQPGNAPHADACLDELCLMYISWSGPRDARLAD